MHELIIARGWMVLWRTVAVWNPGYAGMTVGKWDDCGNREALIEFEDASYHL